ncbi:MAG: flagellar export chaperone FliS [Proteobacteria bacterium]|nr:flagellar export chaperone FliS [Pseudomonadota bacterium]
MTALAQVNTYLSNHYDGMEPEQLILLLYKGALDRLRLTREGIQEKNIKKRGENLSKVIAIISELNASVDPKMQDESTLFLRGLYSAILAELPKVSLTNNLQILDRTEAYIKKLHDIWETDVMGKSTKGSKAGVANPIKRNSRPAAVSGYGSAGTTQRFSAISV